MANWRDDEISSHFTDSSYPPCPSIRHLQGEPHSVPTAQQLFLHDGFATPVKSLTGAVKLLKSVDYFSPDSLVKILGTSQQKQKQKTLWPIVTKRFVDL